MSKNLLLALSSTLICTLTSRHPHPSNTSTILWNKRLQSATSSGHHDRAISLFLDMLRDNARPNHHTFPTVLRAVSNSNPNPTPLSCHQIHSVALKLGLLHPDPFTLNALLSCYSSSGLVVRARQVFDEMPHRDLVSWTSLLSGFSHHGLAGEALGAFLDMRRAEIHVDKVAVSGVLHACGVSRNAWFGMGVHGFYVECGRITWDVVVGTALVDMYGKCGLVDEARKAFCKMPARNVASWTALACAYAHHGDAEGALFVLRGMVAEGVVPNTTTLTSAMAAVAKTGALGHGRELHGHAYRNNALLGSSAVGAALVDMYAKCGCVDQAKKVFWMVDRKDVYARTAMITGLGMHGCASEALELFSTMEEEGIAPNEVTYLGALSTCVHGGLVGEGRLLFDRMVSIHGIKASVKHYGCMVDLLGRAGCVEEALALVASMPVRPSSTVWGVLYGACLVHKKYELAEVVGDFLVRAEPYGDGVLMLMVNMYSAGEKWEEMAGVRRRMKGAGVRKSRGCSWLVLNGVVEEFGAMNMSLAESSNISEILDAITMESKIAGLENNSGVEIMNEE